MVVILTKCCRIVLGERDKLDVLVNGAADDDERRVVSAPSVRVGDLVVGAGRVTSVVLVADDGAAVR